MNLFCCRTSYYGQTHAASGTGYHGGSAFQCKGVQIGHFILGDLFYLCPGHLAHFLAVRLLRTTLNFSGILQLNGSWRGFDDEFERFVGVNCDQDREYFSHPVLCPCIELLTEFHDIDTLGTQCRTNWRCRVGLATLTLKLYIASDFFCHFLLIYWFKRRFISATTPSPKFLNFRRAEL